jgi:hypothetical protein
MGVDTVGHQCLFLIVDNASLDLMELALRI